MSVQAFSWLGNKLGVKFTENTDEGGLDGSAESPLYVDASSRAQPYDPVRGDANHSEEGVGAAAKNLLSGVSTGIGNYWSKASQKVSGMWQNAGGGGRGDPFGTSSQPKRNIFGLDDNAAGLNTDVDENGLPITKNWYYFDSTLNRWAVTPEAPESVRREFEEKLQESERERLGIKKEVAPPPAPHTMAPYGSAGGAPQLPSSSSAFAGGRGRGATPHYAVPDYFGSTQTGFDQPQAGYQPGYQQGYQPQPEPRHTFQSTPASPSSPYGADQGTPSPPQAGMTPAYPPQQATATAPQTGGWTPSAWGASAPASGNNAYMRRPAAPSPATSSAPAGTSQWADVGAVPAYPPAPSRPSAPAVPSAPSAAVPHTTAGGYAAPQMPTPQYATPGPASAQPSSALQPPPASVVPPPTNPSAPLSGPSQPWKPTGPAHTVMPPPSSSSSGYTAAGSWNSGPKPYTPSSSPQPTRDAPVKAAALATHASPALATPSSSPAPVAQTAVNTGNSNPFANRATAPNAASVLPTPTPVSAPAASVASSSVASALPAAPLAAAIPAPPSRGPAVSSSPAQSTERSPAPVPPEAPRHASAVSPPGNPAPPPPPSALHRPEPSTGLRSRYSMPTEFSGAAAVPAAPAPAPAQPTLTAAPPGPAPATRATNPAPASSAQPVHTTSSPSAQQPPSQGYAPATEPTRPSWTAAPLSASQPPQAWRPAPAATPSATDGSGSNTNPFAASPSRAHTTPAQPAAASSGYATVPPPTATPSTQPAAPQPTAPPTVPQSAGGVPPPPSFKPFVPH